MAREQYRLLSASLPSTIGIIVLLNFIFLGLVLLIPKNSQLYVSRIKTAFEVGELGLNDYLPFDSRRGWHQYNDCNILQMISNEDSSRIKKALAPLVYFENEDWNGQCVVLYSIVMEEIDLETLMVSRYARYWHGYNVLTAFALNFMDLKEFREILLGVVLFAIAILAIASHRSSYQAKLTGFIIALTLATVWALPYFAPSITHGPGDAFLIFALAGIIALPRHMISNKLIMLYAAVFGTGVTFFEMLTGQLPLAAGLLIAVILSKARGATQIEDQYVPIIVLAGIIGFGIGAVLTVITKQLLVLVFLEPGLSYQFLSQLRYYIGVPAPEEGWPGILVPFGRLVRKSSNLTYGSQLASYSLIIAIVFIWSVSLIRGWKLRYSNYSKDVLILAIAGFIPFVWVLLMPLHTYIHAGFMVRMLIVPISLAPMALFWRS